MERIYVKNKGEVRYGWTEVPVSRTMSEIMKTLKEHDCDEILTRTSKTGNDQIAFIFQDTPFLITIPKVYVGKGQTLNERIGPRMVLYYLQVVLSWAKIRAIDLDNLLMGQRMVQIGDRNMTMDEVVNQLPAADMLRAFGGKKELPGDDDG